MFCYGFVNIGVNIIFILYVIKLFFGLMIILKMDIVVIKGVWVDGMGSLFIGDFYDLVKLLI